MTQSRKRTTPTPPPPIHNITIVRPVQLVPAHLPRDWDCRSARAPHVQNVACRIRDSRGTPSSKFPRAQNPSSTIHIQRHTHTHATRQSWAASTPSYNWNHSAGCPSRWTVADYWLGGPGTKPKKKSLIDHTDTTATIRRSRGYIALHMSRSLLNELGPAARLRCLTLHSSIPFFFVRLPIREILEQCYLRPATRPANRNETSYSKWPSHLIPARRRPVRRGCCWRSRGRRFDIEPSARPHKPVSRTYSSVP